MKTAVCQHDLVLNYGFSDHELRLYHLDPHDSLTLLDTAPLDPTIDTPTNRLLVSPYGDWMIAPFVSPTFTIQLVSILPSGELATEENLNEHFHEQSITSMRPDGAGFFSSTIGVLANPPFYRQFFFVNPDFTITPVNASQEYQTPEERISETVITQRGDFTVVGQSGNVYRTYHLDPDGGIGDRGVATDTEKVLDTGFNPNRPRLTTNVGNERDVFTVVGIQDGNPSNNVGDTIQLLHIDP